MQLFSEWLLDDTDDKFMKHAACQGLDSKIFFAERGANTFVKKAKSICAKCTVREDCLRYAMNNRIDFGVWGGLSANERIKRARKELKERRNVR
jgi:WhiB family redox-sensing transcriptional regulator